MRREEGEMRQYRNYSLIPSEEETIKGKETTLSEMEKWLEKERSEGSKRGNEERKRVQNTAET